MEVSSLHPRSPMKILNRFGWTADLARWVLVSLIVAGGFALTVLLANFLEYNPLIYSQQAEVEFLLLGFGLSVLMGVLAWKRSLPSRLQVWLRRSRWWEPRLYWQFTLSYFFATLISIFIAMFAGRNAGPFGMFRGSGVVELFARLFDPTTNAGFLVALVAAVSGTLAGLLISRRLTSRLATIARAAETWSRGDFTSTIHDASGDELGQLAHDLNQMAAHVQTLLTAKQALAITEERNRLARDLHDTVKQHVFAGALLVRAARRLVVRDPAQSETYLEEAEALADLTQQELIALIKALRPASLADRGLARVISERAADWSRRMDVLVQVRIQGERETPLDVEEALYHVAEEALANVARHSAAQERGAGTHLERDVPYPDHSG